MKIKTLTFFFFLAILFQIKTNPVAAEVNIFKPPLTWQRSTEAADRIIYEDFLGQKVQEALQLPLDPNQAVFDNGVFMPPANKANVAPGVEWASWPQHTYDGRNPCGPGKELRHFQAKFNLLFDPANIKKVKLISPSYLYDYLPIDDNAHIFFNNHFIISRGTQYQDTLNNLGNSGAAETDGWVVSGDLGTRPIAFLTPGENTIDIVTGEVCKWGGMGKLELVLEVEAPLPFLDLPWDYASKGLTFTEAALAINSFFDHEYPLLSSGLNEPALLVSFRESSRNDLSYSSHDGYDWGKLAKANIGESVLAAADGCASYFNNGSSGNAIKIDHGNGYQTRYYHLTDIDLITQSTTCTAVVKGQQIGRVGASGNVIPPGDLGAHIHFMVVQDKNGDGDFEDNIPDGLTDPFGWQNKELDPWPTYEFFYNEQIRKGNDSFYLWTKAIDSLSKDLTSNGGFFEMERYKLDFPQNATNQNLNIEMEEAPVAKPSNSLKSIGSTLLVTAKNSLGNIVHNFLSLFTITITFDGFDLTGYKTDTISIYSSEDGVNWTREDTTVNLQEKTASAPLDHLSYFALMAERLDTIAPITTAILTGTQGQPNWFRSDVQINLNPQDNIGGLGVDYTFYKIDSGDWQEYKGAFNLSQEGSHQIEFYSVDNDENIEAVKTSSFTIDKSVPEAQIAFNTTSQRIEINGGYNTQVSDLAGNTLIIETDDATSKKLEIERLKYNQTIFEQPENSLEIELQKKKGKIEKFTQTFKLGDLTVKISYDKKKNQSVIEKKQNKKKTIKETKPGIIILTIFTDQGKLEYFY